uniref:Putative tail tubular protein B n=1 Tax=uncultured marine virus TaxID=186617 RepID=A0A0F7LCA5_9VIRU|nr:putative tail tubular protein B [uncultured marine virus]
MPLLNTSIPNLAQGVSQQPDNLRYPGQCDEQINAWSTVVEGLVKRPNSRFLYDTGLGADINTNLFSHYVDRDDENQYLITYDSTNKLKAFDLTAVSIGAATLSIYVEDATAQSYLSVSSGDFNPVKDLRALTIADSTFLVNKKNTVGTLTTNTTPLEKEALIFVKLGDYAKAYSIYIDGQLVPVGGTYQGVNLNNSNHDWDHISPKQTESTYISGPSSAGLNADTSYIAGGLTACLDARFPSGGVNTINTVTIGANGGANYFKPTTPSTTSLITDYKVEVTINQASGSSGPAQAAKGQAIIDSSTGAITGINFTSVGANFNNSNPYQITIKELVKTQLFSRWIEITEFGGWSSQATPATPSNWTFTLSSSNLFSFDRQGSVIKVTNNLDKDFQIRVTDGLNDRALGVIYKEVDSITDLPQSCYNNFRVKIIGDADLDQDDYYVRFKTKDNEDFGEGSWIEVAGWSQDGSSTGSIDNIKTLLDQDTMPVRLVPTPATGKITGFILKTVDWVGRNAGDDNSNPFPTFTDKKINDIFFFKNRLGFLTDDSVVFSEADEYFNFFRTTTQSLLDSAPIDVGVSHTKISILKHAQAFQEKLMLFSPKTQFVLRGGDLLTPKTVTISPVTEFDVSETIRPLALSSYIYFNFKRNNFEGLLEYTVDNNTETYRAAEVTEQINKYIPTNIVRMEGSAAENMVVVQSDSDYKKLYVYKYFWQGNEKIQSSWMTFSFARNVRSFFFIEATLYVITTDSVGTYVEKIPMENGLVESDRGYALLLDSRIASSNATYVSSVAYTRSGGSGLIFNGDPKFDVTKIVSTGGFVFRDGMAVYTKNGNRRALTISNSVNTEAIVDGRLVAYVKYSNYVTNDSYTYKCILTHTSDAAKEPGTGADWETYWERIDSTTIVAPAWALSQNYQTDVLYKCIEGHTSSGTILPETDTQKWELTSEVLSATTWSENSHEYLSEFDFFIGFEYDMLYRFSKQNLKQPTERGGRSASDYTFQTIRNGSIEYADTGHFTVEVTPKFRDTYTYTYNPSLLASVSTLSKFTPETGFFKFAVQAQPNDATIEIKSSSALPVKLLAAEFESTIISRSRRYGG